MLCRWMIAVAAFTVAAQAHARVEIAPYASISSTKAIKPGEVGKETSTQKQRTTYGLRANVRMGKLFRFESSIGQSKLVTTSKVQDTVDDLDSIDFERDLDMNTDDPEAEVKATETQIQARVGVSMDPSFSIFVARAKVGVQASQRTMELEQAGAEPSKVTEPISYKPYAGGGFGIRFSPRVYAIAEYTFLFVEFPELKPFMREVTVSMNVAI